VDENEYSVGDRDYNDTDIALEENTDINEED